MILLNQFNRLRGIRTWDKVQMAILLLLATLGIFCGLRKQRNYSENVE